jgi:hypothetical protein
VDRSLRRTAEERAFDAPVLVAEGDFEVKHLLSVALKAEVPRLDDPRVHGTHGNLMHFIALDPIKVHDADDRIFVAPRPHVRSLSLGPHESHWL